MKLLVSKEQWGRWVKAEEGRFADRIHVAPMRYPCFAYMELESWGQETLRPVYLYQSDIDEMSIQLVATNREM